MGKSPGKWIKTVFSGRKSSRSHSSKESKGKEPELVVGSPVISQQVPDVVDTNIHPEPEVFALTTNETSLLVVSQDAGPSSTLSTEANEPRNEKEEQAATKAQAAFRGYLARRAFHALRGILQLQAIIRGHLVRRQAAATFYCMHAIVRLQAIVRGRRVRLLNEIAKNLHRNLNLEAKHLGYPKADVSSLMRKFPARSFIYKLLSASPAQKLLAIHYPKENPNSIWIWLERWTFSRFWKPVAISKKLVELKSKLKHRIHTPEAESGRPKHSVRRNFSKGDAVSAVSNTDSDRNKHNQKKFSSLDEAVEVNPQSELEKVKRNLRKISSSWAQASNQADTETEKPTHKRVPSSCNGVTKEAAAESLAGVTVTSENGYKKFTTLGADPNPDQYTCNPLSFDVKPTEESAVNDSSKCDNFEENPTETPAAVDSSNCDDLVNEISPLQGVILDDNSNDLYEATPKVELNYEDQKASKRRSSFSTKSEYPENTPTETPKVPSYMAATKSAKAKLRGQSSPRFSLDGSEKNGFIRRHSLPSSNNAKQNSQSPRIQRPAQSSNKGGVPSTKSGGGGNDKPTRAEWKRW